MRRGCSRCVPHHGVVAWGPVGVVCEPADEEAVNGFPPSGWPWRGTIVALVR
jgi:hypothetical protein